MASELMWGGLPFMTPSTLCMRYLYYEDLIPERRIEVGRRYRARKDLVEHVRGYKSVKRSLQRRLAEIEHERKMAHVEEPYMDQVKKFTICFRDHGEGGGEFPRPNGPCISCCHRNTRSSRPMLKTSSVITLLSQPRAEEFLGLTDIRKSLIKNPSEKKQQEY